VGSGSAYATDIVAVQKVYYNQNYNFGCRSPLHTFSSTDLTDTPLDQWMVVMSTQLIGFSIGGIGRRFLVQPPSMSQQPLSCYVFSAT